MQMRLAALSLLAGLLFTPGAPAQSLGDAAQRERERRAKLKAEGRRGTAVLDDEALKGNPGALANDPSLAPAADSPAVGTAPVASPKPKAGIPWPGSGSGGAESAPQSEQAWRARMAAARANLESMTRQYEQLAGAHLATGEYFVDPRTGENLIGGPGRLQKLVAEAKQELELARQRLEALEERARRERVPPGWLR